MILDIPYDNLRALNVARTFTSPLSCYQRLVLQLEASRTANVYRVGLYSLNYKHMRFELGRIEILQVF
jgi:hypothetical protein